MATIRSDRLVAGGYLRAPAPRRKRRRLATVPPRALSISRRSLDPPHTPSPKLSLGGKDWTKASRAPAASTPCSSPQWLSVSRSTSLKLARSRPLLDGNPQRPARAVLVGRHPDHRLRPHDHAETTEFDDQPHRRGRHRTADVRRSDWDVRLVNKYARSLRGFLRSRPLDLPGSPKTRGAGHSSEQQICRVPSMFTDVFLAVEFG